MFKERKSGMTLLELCYNKPDLILLDSTKALEKYRLKHYEKIDPCFLNKRFERLFEAIVKCIEENKCDTMNKFMEQLAAARFDAGYELDEVQTAINTMEQCLWRNICQYVDQDKQINAMKDVSLVLCKAKQKLLTEYALISKEYISA